MFPMLTRRRFAVAALAALAHPVLGARGAAQAAMPEAVAPAAAAPAWATAAAIAYPGPGRRQAGDREVLVSLSEQRLWAYAGETPVLSTLVSTGKAETVTPIGQWRVSVRFPKETMAGETYRLEDVPWVLYFTNEGHALHGTYWHDNFGTPMSRGCVNLPLDVAPWLYDWAPEGTAVTVLP